MNQSNVSEISFVLSTHDRKSLYFAIYKKIPVKNMEDKENWKRSERRSVKFTPDRTGSSFTRGPCELKQETFRTIRQRPTVWRKHCLKSVSITSCALLLAQTRLKFLSENGRNLTRL